jgi:hypothetical protein
MGIMTHTSIAKEKPNSRTEHSKTVTTPKEWRSTWHSKSPRSADINSLLAEINLPTSWFENFLKALCPLMGSDSQKEDLVNPCNLTPPSEKNNQITPHASPMSIDHHSFLVNGAAKNPTTDGSPQDHATPPTRGVRISKTATTVDADATPAVSSTSRKLILQLAVRRTTQEFYRAPADDDDGQSKSHLKKIHDRTNKLFRVFSGNGMKEKSYHVTDFAGLYPVWPIIEFSMSPTRTVKDKKMTLFTKCVTALLGEVWYVNNTAMITTTSITKDESNFISSKEDLPTNFTKPGKHVMISSGSWVFNKKEKGRNNVYARFRLKSQVDTEEIINCVSFEFSCLGRKIYTRSSTKQWRRKLQWCYSLSAMGWIKQVLLAELVWMNSCDVWIHLMYGNTSGVELLEERLQQAPPCELTSLVITPL